MHEKQTQDSSPPTPASLSAPTSVFVLCIRSITRYGEPVVSWDPDGLRLTLTAGCATMSDLVDLQTVDGENVGPVYHFSQVGDFVQDNGFAVTS